MRRSIDSVKRTLVALSVICLTGVLVTSCKKKEADPPKKVRYDVSAQINVNGTKADSKAKGTITAEYLSTTRELTYNITYEGMETTDVNVHHGTAAALGKAAVNIKKQGAKYASPIKGTVTLTGETADALFKDNLYLNLVSVKFPQGEIRGQLIVKNKNAPR